MKKFIFVLAAFLAFASSTVFAEVKTKENPVKILCIGNSFTRDAIFQVPDLMASAGVDNVAITFAYHGGRPMRDHSNWTLKDYTVYKAEAGAPKWKTVSGNKAKDKAEISLEEICKSDNWDIITFQEYSGNPDAWVWTDVQKGYFEKMFKQVNSCLSKEVTYYYILTHAFYDMSKLSKKKTWGQHETAKMFEVVAENGRKVMSDFPAFKDIISTGAAVENLRTTSLMNDEWGLSRDGFHLDYGVARCAAACTFFEIVITPLCNKKLDRIKYEYSDQPTKHYCTPVTKKNFPTCLKAARAAIKRPYSITKIKG